MNLKKIFGLAVLVCILYQESISQDYMFATNIHVNNRGYGLGFSLTETAGSRINTSYELTIAGLRDLKEIRISNVDLINAAVNPGAFVFGKINYVMAVRVGYGKEVTLAKRIDRNAVGILWNSHIGLNLGLQTPTYIDYSTPGQNDFGFITVRYDPRVHARRNIFQSHSFLRGFSEVRVLPGIYTKQGIVLEFGNYTYAPNRLEAGIMADVYFIRPEIMYRQKHQRVFLSFYVSFAVLNFGV